VGAVVSLRSTDGYTETRCGTEATGRGKTDSQGKYKLAVYTKPGTQVHHADKDPTWDKALDLLRKKVQSAGH
jgi:hypothetical protein